MLKSMLTSAAFAGAW